MYNWWICIIDVRLNDRVKITRENERELGKRKWRGIINNKKKRDGGAKKVFRENDEKESRESNERWG